MQASLDGTCNNNKKLVRSCDHPGIENAWNTYIRAIIWFTVGVFIQRGCNSEIALKLQKELVTELGDLFQTAVSDCLSAKQDVLKANLESLSSFNNSKHWFYNFMCPRALFSINPGDRVKCGEDSKPSLHRLPKSAKMSQKEMQLVISADMLNNARFTEIIQILAMDMDKVMTKV